MKIVYDPRFADSLYADDNAALPGRMEAAMSGLLRGGWQVLKPQAATEAELLRAHDAAHIAAVRTRSALFAMASLAAGGALLAARLAASGEAAFACVRPPGHHASRGSGWGYCSFNNIATALLVLRAEGAVLAPFVLDIDQHTGDGTRSLLGSWEGARTFNPFAEGRRVYLDLVEAELAGLVKADMVAVSAGFDAYRLDVGRKLDTGDFETLGGLAKRASLRLCGGRRFAVLEGGYYLEDLGANVLAFCRGFA